jgi:hypothetical protein
MMSAQPPKERHAHDDAEGYGHHAQAQRVSSPVHEQEQLVAAEVVGAEDMALLARREQDRGELILARVEREQDRSHDRGDRVDGEHGKTQHRASMADQPPPGGGRPHAGGSLWREALRLEGLSCSGCGDRHMRK